MLLCRAKRETEWESVRERERGIEGRKEFGQQVWSQIGPQAHSKCTDNRFKAYSWCTIISQIMIIIVIIIVIIIIIMIIWWRVGSLTANRHITGSPFSLHLPTNILLLLLRYCGIVVVNIHYYGVSLFYLFLSTRSAYSSLCFPSPFRFHFHVVIWLPSLIDVVNTDY